MNRCWFGIGSEREKLWCDKPGVWRMVSDDPNISPENIFCEEHEPEGRVVRVEAPGAEMNTYRIGTFVHPRKRKPLVVAYSMWFNPEWEGCVVHDVEATSAAEAKKVAIGERKKMEGIE